MSIVVTHIPMPNRNILNWSLLVISTGMKYSSYCTNLEYHEGRKCFDDTDTYRDHDEWGFDYTGGKI